MTNEELLLKDIAAYLDAIEPLPALWSLSKGNASDLDDPWLLAMLSGIPKPSQSETQQQQEHDPVDTGLKILDCLRQSSDMSSCNTDSMSDNAQQQPTTNNSTIKTKRSRNLRRERVHNELKSLRVQSTELQQRLAILREHRQQVQKQDQLLVATWERTAKRQLEARTHAERENRRLKTQLDHQMALAQNFRQFVARLETVRPSFEMPCNLIEARPAVVINADDIAIFESLFSELDATHSKMDAVFDENGLNAWQLGVTTIPKAKMKTRRSNVATDANSLYIELTNTNVVPFPLELVFNTLWECWEHQEVQRGYATHYFEDGPKTSSANKTHVDICFNGCRVSLEYLNVTKVYVEDGRVSSVWRSRTKGHPNFPNMCVDEMGWQAIKCSQMECKKLSGPLNLHKRTGENPLANLVVSALEEDLVQVDEMMMDLLLQDKTPSSSPSTLWLPAVWTWLMMAVEELSLEDITAYLETFEPCPSLWSFSRLEDSDLDDLHTRLEPSGIPQPSQSETDEQEQNGARIDPPATPEQRSNASSSNEGRSTKTAAPYAQQSGAIVRNPQPSQCETRDQQQDSGRIDPGTPVPSPLSSNSSSSNEESDTKSTSQDIHPRHANAKPRNPTTRAKRSRNPSREKMQNELKSLRLQSMELQQRLALMREHKQQEHKQDLLLVVTWERIAKRQLEARTHAERENRRLKTQLDHQMALVENFQHFIGHMESSRPSFVAPRNLIDTTHGVVIGADDISIFESLFLELDATYSKMDAVFNENGLNAWQVGMSTDIKAQMKTRRSNIATDADSLYIELIDTNVVPFPLELVFNTLWECWDRQSGERSYSMYQFPGEPESSCGMKVRIDICFNGQHVALDFLSVSKLFIEDGRRIFVWRSQTKVHPRFPDMYVDEMGWQMIKSIGMPGGEGEDASSNITALLMCSQLECKKLSDPLNLHDQHQRTGENPLANLVVSALEDDLLQVNAMMMDMLLQDKTPPSPLSIS
ncbi:hypothetical protein FI667_g2898, partial [Globisporangium splendens]